MTDEEVQPLRPRIGRLTLIFVIVALGGWIAARAFDAPTSGTVGLTGTIAPEIVVDTFDGATWRLSESLGDGPIVVNLWASYCKPCIEEIPELARFAQENQRVTVVGAAVRDDPDEARAFAERLAPEYLIGMDATARLRDALPTIGLPATFVIDASGMITAQFERPITAGDLEASLR